MMPGAIAVMNKVFYFAEDVANYLVNGSSPDLCTDAV